MMLKKQSNDVVVVVVSSIPNLIEIEKKSQEQATAGGQEKCQPTSVHLSNTSEGVCPSTVIASPCRRPVSCLGKPTYLGLAYRGLEASEVTVGWSRHHPSRLKDRCKY